MDAPGTWTRLSQREAYAHFIRVRVDTYRTGSGSVSEWDVLEQPDCVCVVAFTERGTALVFEQFRVGPERRIAEIPGGIVDPGEEPVAAALRELREETGYSAGVHWYAGSEWTGASSTRRKHVVIAGDCVRAGDPEWGDDESGVVRELSAGALLAHLLAGESTDSGAAVRALVRFAREADVAPELVGLRGAVRDLLAL